MQKLYTLGHAVYYQTYGICNPTSNSPLSATAFRNAKAFEQCKDCLMKAADCHKQSRSLFYAAKALDQAILVCKEMGDLREVPSLAQRAANMYQTHGSGDTAVSSLDKAAKILEQQQPQQALGLYLNAANIATVSQYY